MLLSRNYPPSPGLAPYIARHYIFSANLPDDFELIDRILSETAFIRILLKGDWAAETVPDEWHRAGRVPFFGSNSRPLRVRVRGPFHVVGIALRPSGWRALFKQPASDFADRMLPLEDLWGDVATRLLDTVCAAKEDSLVITAAEAALTEQLERRGSWQIDWLMRSFERIARMDSTMKVRDVAAHLGLSERQLERHCRACFGHSPKTLLRRSRFLDLAAVLRGLGNPSDEELAALRYFDQSHLAHEFRRFICMTPTEFTRTPTPLLTAGLELRQERKAGTDDR